MPCAQPQGEEKSSPLAKHLKHLKPPNALGNWRVFQFGGAALTIQFSTTVRNARLDAIETAISTSAVAKIRTGAPPATTGAADTGTVLATLSLPSDWMSAASGGSKAKTGTWQDTSADAAGTAAHFRVYATDGTTTHIQGTVTATSGGGDMEVDNTSFAIAQQFTITSFTLTDGNA
jgi:hypothetical protein